MVTLLIWITHSALVLRALLSQEEGQEGMEYAIVGAVVLGLVAAATVAGFPTLSRIPADFFTAVGSSWGPLVSGH